MDLELFPRRLSGAVTPPPSKSQAHRLLLCAALAEGTSSLHNIYFSDDVRATLGCIEALGARCEELGDGSLRLMGTGGRGIPEGLPRFDCGESGSTLRFLLPVALTLCGGGSFTGRGRLLRRPQKPYFDLFDEKGIRWELTDRSLTVRGKLPAGAYRLPGNVSSQFFTGLLLALPLAEGESLVTAATSVESADYIAMTLDALACAGVEIEAEENAWRIRPQSYRPFEASVEPDWSQAAFWIAARQLGNELRVCGLSDDSRQGDRAIARFAEELSREGDLVLNVAQCPDLLPPLAAMAAVRNGRCRLEGAARLRYKESDRLASVTAALRALGAQISEEPDALEICGADALHGGTVDCCGDHRIAMTAAVAATRCERGSVRLLGADCVKKSYPDFWEVYQALGGECHVLSMG